MGPADGSAPLPEPTPAPGPGSSPDPAPGPGTPPGPAPAPARRRGSTAKPPLGRRFTLVWASVTTSALGDGMRFVALPLLAGRLTTDPRQIAAVVLAEQAPWLVLGLPAGAVADRVERRRLLWITDACRTVVAVVLALTVATGRDTVALLVGAGLLLGAGQTLYNGAWAGIVPALVPPSALTRANARVMGGSLVADTLVGTMFGAALFGVAASLPFFVDSASFAAATVLVLLLGGGSRLGAGGPPDGGGVTARTAGGSGPDAAGWAALCSSLRRDVAEGVRHLVRHPTLRRLCAVAGLLDLANGGMIAVLVLYARRALGLGDLGFAALVAVYALGGVAGTALAGRLVARFGSRGVLTSATVCAVLAVALASVARGAVPGATAVAVFGAADLLWNVTAVSLRQSLVPHHLLGRVTMAYQLVANGASALGAAGAGFLAHAVGVRGPFACAVVLLAVAVAVGATGRRGNSGTGRGGSPR